MKLLPCPLVEAATPWKPVPLDQQTKIVGSGITSYPREPLGVMVRGTSTTFTLWYSAP